MRKSKRLAVLLAIVVALGLGCASSGNGGGDGGTLTVSVTEFDPYAFPTAQAPPVKLVYGVFAQDMPPDTLENALAVGVEELVSGAASAQAMLGDLTTPWKGKNGNTYDLYIWIEMDDPSDPFPSDGDWCVGDSDGPDAQPVEISGNTVVNLDQSDFDWMPGD
jgi:hypothetical protein